MILYLKYEVGQSRGKRLQPCPPPLQYFVLSNNITFYLLLCSYWQKPCSLLPIHVHYKKINIFYINFFMKFREYVELEIGRTVKRVVRKKWKADRKNTLSCVMSTHNIQSKVFLRKGWPFWLQIFWKVA